MSPSPVESRFDTMRDYRRAVADLLPLAQRRIAVFDPDLAAPDFESIEAIETLTRFASTRRSNLLQVVLHRTQHVERNCPRLLALRRLYGHAILVRQSPEELRQLTDCFVLADGLHGVIRFHADHAKGKFLMHHEQELGPWQRRFDELWEMSSPVLAATTLGL